METAFFTMYNRLCAEKGISASAAAEKIGLSNSTVTSWKNGALPRRPTIKKVADYFGVTVDQMMGYEAIEKPSTMLGGGEEKPPAQEGKELTQTDIKLILSKLSTSELIQVIADASEELRKKGDAQI